MKFTFPKVLFATVFALNSLLLSAQTQISIYPENPPAVTSLSVGDATGGIYQVTVKNATSAALTDYKLKVGMPAGAEYISAPTAPTGVTAVDATDLQNPVFMLSNIVADTELTISFSIRLGCSYVHQNNGNNFFTYTLYDNTSAEVAAESGDGPSSVYRPQMNVSPLAPMIIDVRTPAPRSITVQNLGAKLDTLLIDDLHDTNKLDIGVPVGDISDIPGGKRIKLWGAALQSAITINGGNGDAIFDNGETLTITENIQLKTCEAATTDVTAWVRDFNGTVCTSSTQSAGISTFSSLPVLSYYRPSIAAADNKMPTLCAS
ncbi:MAG: hypothetical protein LBU62_06600, partial [Bacteroidales bacterium]|nr:hypothetical protein [Bacteroidales bacterium]